MQLQGKTALITGGAVRIGRQIALALAGEGVHIQLHYGRSAEKAQETCGHIQSLGVRAGAVQGDLGQGPETMERILREAGRDAPVDILVNNASIFEPGELASTTEDAFDRHLAINLKAPLFLTQAMVRRLGDGRQGCVINMVDWRASRPNAGHLSYTLSKAGLAALTVILAQELAPQVRVNAIAPGAILPPHGQSPEEFANRAANIPLRRAGTPGDVAAAALYLLRSDFITGEVVHVSGGEHL